MVSYLTEARFTERAVGPRGHHLRNLVVHAAYMLLAIGLGWLIALPAPAQATTSCTAALCVLDPTAKDALQAKPGTIAVTGAILVNSTDNEAVLASGESGTAMITATGTLGGPAAPAGFVSRNTGTFSPAPVNQPAGTDPFSSLPLCPSATGCPTTPAPPFASVILAAGSRTINPGVYASISVAGGAQLTLNPGTYVVTVGLTITDAATRLTGTGVTVYFACSTYPTPCTSAISGAFFTANVGANATLNAPAAGVYAGLSMIADRNNKAVIRVSGAATTTAGGIYGATVSLSVSGTATFTRAVVGTAETTGSQSASIRIVPAAGILSITVPATANLGGGIPGTTVGSVLGSVTVTDQRGISNASWTATVSITDFTGPAAFTITKATCPTGPDLPRPPLGPAPSPPGRPLSHRHSR